MASPKADHQCYVLIGSEHSLYTGKLRAYLIWRDLPFKELTASAQLYKQVIIPRTGVAYIPVLVLPDHFTVLQDTHAIIHHFEQQLFKPPQQLLQQSQQHHCHAACTSTPPQHLLSTPLSPNGMQQQQQQQDPRHTPSTSTTCHNVSSSSSSTATHHHRSNMCETCCSTAEAPPTCPMPAPLLPSTARRAAADQLLALYGDEWLLLPAMHYRWSFPQQRQRLLYQFGSTNTPTAPYEQQMAAGAKVAAHFSGMLPALGITPDSIPVIEARFKWQMAVLQEHFKHHAYLLGSVQPSLCDFSCIGPLLAHLYLDPVPSCLMQCEAPLLADYVERLSGMHSQARVVDRVLQHGGGAAVVTSPVIAGACPAATCSTTAAPAAAASRSCVMWAGLQPQDVKHPAEGQLFPRALLLNCQAQQQQQPEHGRSPTTGGGEGLHRHKHVGTLAAAPAASSAADCVPASMLALLHHMFLEQAPIIISTLQLLKAWLQHQPSPHPSSSTASATATNTVRPTASTVPGQQATQSTLSSKPGSTAAHGGLGSSSSMSMADSADDGSRGTWLTVPRSLGRHPFKLHDVVTGDPLTPAGGPLQRVASSYVAWRAAELVQWYQQLPGSDRAEVHQLLQDISTASSSACSATHAAGIKGCSPTAAAVGAQAVGFDAAALSAQCPMVAGMVDAVKSFEHIVALVGECGPIERRNNRVVVWQANGQCCAAGNCAPAAVSKL